MGWFLLKIDHIDSLCTMPLKMMTASSMIALSVLFVIIFDKAIVFRFTYYFMTLFSPHESSICIRRNLLKRCLTSLMPFHWTTRTPLTWMHVCTSLHQSAPRLVWCLIHHQGKMNFEPHDQTIADHIIILTHAAIEQRSLSKNRPGDARHIYRCDHHDTTKSTPQHHNQLNYVRTTACC